MRGFRAPGSRSEYGGFEFRDQDRSEFGGFEFRDQDKENKIETEGLFPRILVAEKIRAVRHDHNK